MLYLSYCFISSFFLPPDSSCPDSLVLLSVHSLSIVSVHDSSSNFSSIVSLSFRDSSSWAWKKMNVNQNNYIVFSFGIFCPLYFEFLLNVFHSLCFSHTVLHLFIFDYICIITSSNTNQMSYF